MCYAVEALNKKVTNQCVMKTKGSRGSYNRGKILEAVSPETLETLLKQWVSLSGCRNQSIEEGVFPNLPAVLNLKSRADFFETTFFVVLTLGSVLTSFSVPRLVAEYLTSKFTSRDGEPYNNFFYA